MNWNYRIMEDGKGRSKYYSLREVFYNDNNEIRGFSSEPDTPLGDTAKDLIKVIEMMLKDAKKCKENILKSDVKCKGWEEIK